MLNNKITDQLSVSAVIVKSTIMFCVGICISWAVSTLHDTSVILMIVVWVMCELIANVFIRPMIELVENLRIGE